MKNSKKESKALTSPEGDELWPRGKPIPEFQTDEEAERFYERYSFAEWIDDDAPGVDLQTEAKRRSSSMQPLSVRVEADDLTRLRALARKQRTTLSQLLREAIRAYLQAEKESDPTRKRRSQKKRERARRS